MRTAFRSIDVIDERVDILVKGIVVLDGHFHHHGILQSFTVDDLLVERRLAAVQVRDKFLDPAFVVECVLSLLFSFVPQDDLQVLCQERCLTESCLQSIIVVDCLLKDLTVRKESYSCAAFFRSALSGHCDRGYDFAPLKFFFVDLSFAAHLDFQPLGKRIDYGSTNTVQSSGDLVSPASEFAAGMQDGKYDFQGRDPCLFLDIHRNTAAIVNNCHGIIRIHGHCDHAAETGQCLIYRVVHNLVDQMMKSSGRSGTDIHTGSSSHTFQALKDLDLIRIVFRTHSVSSYISAIHFLIRSLPGKLLPLSRPRS